MTGAPSATHTGPLCEFLWSASTNLGIHCRISVPFLRRFKSVVEFGSDRAVCWSMWCCPLSVSHRDVHFALFGHASKPPERVRKHAMSFRIRAWFLCVVSSPSIVISQTRKVRLGGPKVLHSLSHQCSTLASVQECSGIWVGSGRALEYVMLSVVCSPS